MRRVTLKLLIMFAGMTSPSAIFANGQVDNVLIEKVAVLGNVVFVKTNAASVAGTPGCSVNGVWHFAFAGSNDAMMATVLSARVTRTPVYISGGGVCTNFSAVEDLHQIQM